MMIGIDPEDQAMVAKAGRPEDIPDTSQMQEVARLYYKEDATRQEIAKRLHIDPRKVTWLLEQARTLGVVRIDIRENLDEEISARLQRKFPQLEKVFVVPGPEIKTIEQCDDFFRRFGLLAADYFEELLKQHPRGKPIHVGVGGGARSLEFAYAVRPSIRSTVHIHPTALIGRGGFGKESRFVEPSAVATILWTQSGSLGGHCDYVTVEPYWIPMLYPPAVLEEELTARDVVIREVERLEKIEDIKRVIEAMDDLDVVFGGFDYLGVPYDSFEIQDLVSTANLLQGFAGATELTDENVIGAFCHCLFGTEGLSEKRWRFFLTAGHYSEHPGIEFYKNMVARGKKVVGIGGPGLFNVINAALKAEIVNVLIIDEFTARKIADTI